jgi:hypothetical protein
MHCISIAEGKRMILAIHRRHFVLIQLAPGQGMQDSSSLAYQMSLDEIHSEYIDINVSCSPQILSIRIGNPLKVIPRKKSGGEGV